MITEFLRYWSILDLGVLRRWLTDTQIQTAEKIDNKDGTYGVAFDLRGVPAEAFIAVSDLMQGALAGDPIVPLSTAPPRVLSKPPCLQALVAQHGGYNLITPEAWSQYDRAVAEHRTLMREGRLEIG